MTDADFAFTINSVHLCDEARWDLCTHSLRANCSEFEVEIDHVRDAACVYGRWKDGAEPLDALPDRYGTGKSRFRVRP